MEPETLQPRVNPQLVKILAAIVGAVFIGALILAFTHKSQVVSENDEFTNSNFSRDALVAATPEGFVPSTLTISSHTRVTWSSGDGQRHHIMLNDTTQEDGPAADITNDPQLPNGAEVVPGTDITHVFEKPGTYVFHDQENPTKNVSITVN
jgi:plastocyanin